MRVFLRQVPKLFFVAELIARGATSNDTVEPLARERERFESEDEDINTGAGAAASVSAAQWAQSWQWFQERRRLVSRALNAYLTCIAIPLPLILNGGSLCVEQFCIYTYVYVHTFV